jgi:hypothetical protein
MAGSHQGNLPLHSAAVREEGAGSSSFHLPHLYILTAQVCTQYIWSSHKGCVQLPRGRIQASWNSQPWSSLNDYCRHPPLSSFRVLV